MEKKIDFVSRTKGTLFLLVIVLQLLAPAIGAAGGEKIVIGLIPEMNVFKQVERFQPLADFLGEKLNTKVQLSMLSRYGNIIEKFEKLDIDAAFLGSFTGALAISQLGVEPLVRPVNQDGTSTYFGYIFARRSSGVSSVSDMQGKTFVLVERATTAGYIFPLALVKRNGVDNISTFLKSYYFAGSHDATIAAVLSGQADIGAAKNTIYELSRKNNPNIDKELTIIAKSPRVPSNGLCVKANMIDAQKKRLKEELVALHESGEGRRVLKALGAQRFVETSKKDYKPVFDLAAEAGINIKDYQYLNQ